MNKLSPTEVNAVLEVCNTPEMAHLPPSQIVPRLADQGVYLASEASFYRILKKHNQASKRGRASVGCKKSCLRVTPLQRPIKYGPGI